MENTQKFKAIIMAKGMIELAKELNQKEFKTRALSNTKNKQVDNSEEVARNLKDLIKSMDETTKGMVFYVINSLAQEAEEKVTGKNSLSPDAIVGNIEITQACNLLNNFKFIAEAKQNIEKSEKSTNDAGMTM